jgi:glycine/serine hydroxymethyltransferase
MGLSEMETIADCIFRVLDAMGDTAVEESVRRTVGELCAGFPLVA